MVSMIMRIKYHLWIIAVLYAVGCDQQQYTDFNLTKFHYIKKDYDEYIINRDYGFHQLTGYPVADSAHGIIVLHGYYPWGWTTKGFEWAEPLHELSKLKVPIWLYRYDWNQCPEQIMEQYSEEMMEFVMDNPYLDSLWVLGHSYGGMITALFSEQWNGSMPLTVHSIAAALAGTDRMRSECKFSKETGYFIQDNVQFTQWRTIHEQDGAFKKMETDPQITTLYNGHYIDLPSHWGDLRLGHNLSVKWVCKSLLNSL